jgi:hypothetical protein
MEELSSLSTEYVPFRVAATDWDGVAVDLSADTVQVAFVPLSTEPVTADWQAATWLDTGVAGILVGPGVGGLVLADGKYAQWVKVTDNPERPAYMVGTLHIT